MKLMTTEEGEHWLHSIGIETYRAGRLYFATPTTTYLLPKDSGAKTALARLLTNEVFAEKPVVLILEEIGVWTSSENEFLFTKYREAVSSNQNISHQPFDDYPFHYAEAHEAASMEGLIALCLYFIWGVAIFDGDGETFIKISHDEWIEVGSTNVARCNDVIKLFDSFGLVRIS